MNAAPLHTPLCPAGHLPLKGGDRPSPQSSPIAKVGEWEPEQAIGVISPLEGEMGGSPEGGELGSRDTGGAR
jgi:hypothetical protein